MNTKYSVIMPLYYKENPCYLEESLLSLVNQSIVSDDIIIVADGPLTNELDEVLLKFVKKYSFIKVIRIPENHGAGYASMIALQETKNDIVARMDSDDIAYPNRMEEELKILEKGFDFVGGAITEFIDDPKNIISTKFVPQNMDKIIKYSKKRNPCCNVTTMYKKSVVLDIGGYQNQPFLEDYTICIKVIQKGYKIYNIQSPMVNVRTSKEQLERRGDKRVRKYLKNLRKYMLKTKYINIFEYLLYNFETDVFCLSPKWLKRLFYKKVLRK